MSVTTRRAPRGGQATRRAAGPRADDPRVVRSRAAVVDAARQLFMQKGYDGTTMEDIAAAAGLTKRTLYNNYADKDALFRQIVAEAMAFAGAFAQGLHEEFTGKITAASLPAMLDDLAQRIALAIMRAEIIALRRLLIGEAGAFPALATAYFDRAPGQVLDALASGFAHLGRESCCASLTRSSRPHSSPTSSSANLSIARCWSGRSRPGSTSSRTRAKAW